MVIKEFFSVPILSVVVGSSVAFRSPVVERLYCIKKMDKNLLGRRKRAIARITYAGDKLGFCKSGHIYVYMFVDQKIESYFSD